jgi:class 3 adenylate cyclase/CHASE2 domain-containing sensor protein
MIPAPSKRLIFTFIRAMLLAVLAVAVTWGGYMTKFEHVLYSERFVHCQRYTPAPTKELVHLDIDDKALSQIGRWPWSRRDIAEILDEVRLTKPKVLAMDTLLSEPAGPDFTNDGKRLDDDAILGDSIARFGRALVPVSVSFDPVAANGIVATRLRQLLIENPELTSEQCVALLRAEGLDLSSIDEQIFLSVWPAAIYERIRREVSMLPNSSNIDADMAAAPQIKLKMIPHLDPLSRSSLERLFDEEFAVVIRERVLQRFTLPMQPGLPPILAATRQITPILPLAQAAAFSGFVDYLPDSTEGTVHSVPLFIKYRDRLVPHFSLVIACAMLGVDIHDLQLTADNITIPCPDGRKIVIPVSSRKSAGLGDVSMLMEVPMFGRKNQWETMYDYPRHEKPVQHVSVAEVWQAVTTRRRMEANERSADKVLVLALKLTDPETAADYETAPKTGEDRNAFIASTLDTLDVLAGVEAPDAKSRELRDNLKKYSAQLREVLTQRELIGRQLVRLRAAMAEQLAGRALLLGGTGTGQTDMRTTTLFFSCPGVVIHGAIVNGILTGRMWRVAPETVTLWVTAAMGIFAAFAVCLLSPALAFGASAALAIGYLAFNGYVLFDYHSLIVGAAGPMLAVGLVYLGTTLTNFITEVAERKRITRRFSNYVDPALVKWVQDHPHQTRFDGESREMTIGFTDLAGFTALMDELGEATVPILADYMSAMVPVIRSHQGYVAKLMGDGIYFFFGAPRPDSEHAVRAVAALLGMQVALEAFNKKQIARNQKPLAMRAGLSTGQVIIGDAGAKDFSDYTALGPSTNLASRLESANKVFGTHALVTDRTIELLNGSYLVRPIANLVVAGKSVPVLVYEPICLINDATEEQRRLAKETEQLEKAFRKGQFEACIETAEKMDQAFGPSKLTHFYCELCREYLKTPPIDFKGRVVLTEK